VTVALREIEDLIDAYGGPMPLSAFVRMLSDGSRSAAPPTEEDAAVMEIARRVRGEKWEQIIFRSTTVDDIVRGLADEGIEVTEPEIRLLTSKLGRMGLIDAVHAKMDR
jgi:hypothetical protein